MERGGDLPAGNWDAREPAPQESGTLVAGMKGRRLYSLPEPPESRVRVPRPPASRPPPQTDKVFTPPAQTFCCRQPRAPAQTTPTLPHQRPQNGGDTMKVLVRTPEGVEEVRDVDAEYIIPGDLLDDGSLVLDLWDELSDDDYLAIGLYD